MASEDESKSKGEVGDAGGVADSDDLASLADGLPSLRPAPGEAADGEDDAGLDLKRLVGTAAASMDSDAPSAERAASADKPAASAADSAALKDLAAAAATASVIPPAQKRPWLVPMLVGLGLGVGLGGVGFGLSATRAPAPPAASPTSESVSTPPPVAAAPEPAPQEAPVQEASAPTVAAVPSPDAPAAIEPGAIKPQAGDHHAATAPRTPHNAAAAPSADPASATAAPVLNVKPASAPAEGATAGNDPLAEPAPDKKDPRSMDALLDEALAPAAQRNELAHQRELAIHDDELPLTPSRDDVTKAMTVLLPAIRGCAMGQSGLATAGIVVRNDGRVASVEIAGPPFAGTASGRCMEGVMRRAQFPRFKQAIFRIKFPFAIQ